MTSKIQVEQKSIAHSKKRLEVRGRSMVNPESNGNKEVRSSEASMGVQTGAHYKKSFYLVLFIYFNNIGINILV